MEPNIDIGPSDREAVVKILNAVLADEYVLYTRTRNYHWNAVSPRFRDLHALFQEQYEKLAEIIDDAAERARMLGGRPAGTLAEFIDQARLKELPGRVPDAHEMVADLLAGHEALIRTLRVDANVVLDEHGDVGTQDELTGFLKAHEKMAWMLRATLEGR